MPGSGSSSPGRPCNRSSSFPERRSTCPGSTPSSSPSGARRSRSTRREGSPWPPPSSHPRARGFRGCRTAGKSSGFDRGPSDFRQCARTGFASGVPDRGQPRPLAHAPPCACDPGPVVAGAMATGRTTSAPAAGEEEFLGTSLFLGTFRGCRRAQQAEGVGAQ